MSDELQMKWSGKAARVFSVSCLGVEIQLARLGVDRDVLEDGAEAARRGVDVRLVDVASRMVLA